MMTPDHRMPQWLKVQANEESASKRSISKPTNGRRRYLMLRKSLELFAKPTRATEKSTSLMRFIGSDSVGDARRNHQKSFLISLVLPNHTRIQRSCRPERRELWLLAVG
jgi:hypothetical protein